MPDPTTNYGWDVPTPGGSTGAWATLLNAVFDAIDTDLKAAEDKADAAQADADAATTTANAALPKAGGVMTGRLDALTSTAKKISSTSSGATALDVSLGNYFAITTTGNITISFTNVPSGTFATGIVILVNPGGAHTVTWPASVKWPGGTTPTQTANKIDIYSLITDDNGTTWRGVRVIRDSL